jgi:hypothetical protein
MAEESTPVGDNGPIIMVSSSVYGIEDLLEQVFAILSGAGFRVWMSYKGTVPVDPSKSNFENCLSAVENCDLFLGILTNRYGSGRDKETDGLSITHQEVLRALQLNKPRWFLAHHDLIFARRLLADLGYGTSDERGQLTVRHKSVVDDLRTIDMYDAVIQAERQLKDRIGNWAQPFATNADANVFVVAQFFRYAEAVEIVKQQPARAKGLPRGGGVQ